GGLCFRRRGAHGPNVGRGMRGRIGDVAAPVGIGRNGPVPVPGTGHGSKRRGRLGPVQVPGTRHGRRSPVRRPPRPAAQSPKRPAARDPTVASAAEPPFGRPSFRHSETKETHLTVAPSADTAPISGLDQLAIDTIRTLAIDAVQAASSGHPGTPMAMAPVAYTLWQRHLRFDPDDPIWPNRDRYVHSMGHASTLLYALLHLAQVKAVNPAYETLGELSVPLDDLRRFRQIQSKAPGHPEYRWTSGVETTTGPLGAGVATSVGMAIASCWQAAHFNRPGFELFDYDVYALAGDGCLMEGVSSEAASLAGHLQLSNLCWIYDSNRITIE